MSTRRWILLVVAASLASVAATFLAQRRMQSDVGALGGRVLSLQSAALGERREYSVYPPAGYDSATATRYPVLYVLDAETEALHSAESAAALARIGVIPPIIVVGISSGNNGRRARDFTPPTQWRDSAGGAPHFLSFLERELMPRIDAEYRTARPRMLAGTSRSGLFVLYSQIAAPTLFDARFGLSPFVWGEEDELAVTRFEEGLNAASGFLYLSLGDGEPQTTPPFKHAIRVLESHAPPTLRWRADYTVGGRHETNARLSIPVALCATFAPSAACRPGRATP